MKTIYKSLLAVVVATPALTGCLDEATMTSGATQDQLASSSKAVEALLWANPAYFNTFNLMDASQGYDWGYGSLMHLRDVMTEDMAITYCDYDWYSYWAQCTYMGESWMFQQWSWNFYYKQILTANNLIGAIDEETASEQMLTYLGMGLGFRASAYLDMARTYEFLPNAVVSSINLDGNDVLGLTVPIVTDKTTEEEARNNPRAPHAEMFAFIMGDLDKAESLLTGKSRSSKSLIDVTVIYGLKARAYMWDGQYGLAAEYARKAISSGKYTPLTRDQWLSTSNGFNSYDSNDSWMWGGRATKEDGCVQSGILNWTSWASNETTYGYAAAGPYVMIGKSVYDRISNRDFRKLSFKAPEGSALAGLEPVIDAELAAGLPDYASFKIRPKDGNISDYNIASASDLPLMRIEEMYFIEAEATAQTNPAAGKQLLMDFMKSYRYATYTTNASSKEDIIDEIIFQKRVELWGEGQTFYDVKRLDMSVTRGYEGSNFDEACQYNTVGRPAWMNYVATRQEGNNNAGFVGWNNPDPSGKYSPANY